MKTEPLITIITSTYNSGAVLEALIKSIKEQTYKNFEYIIVDGASKDDTLNIIDQYKDVVSKWISEPDSGIYDAWNKGVKLAKGDWICFIGSDDKFYPDALSNYAEIITSLNDPGLQYVSSRIHLVNKHDKIVKTLGQAWKWEKDRYKNTIAHPGSMHNKALFKEYGLYDTQWAICSDYEILLRPGKKFKTAFMDKVTVRMAQGGASSNGSKLFKEHYKVCRTTGKAGLFMASYYYVFQMTKYYVRTLLQKMGVNV
ncbi:glycosyltransferase family 2 protein [Mucilaginibacter sp. AW1-3]